MACNCPICCNDYNMYKMLACPKCSFEACHSCIVNFIKTTNGDVVCMSCKKVWDSVFLFQSLPPSIVYGDLKAKREAVLLERETILLPATQQILPLLKKKEESFSELNHLYKELENVKKRIQAKNEEIGSLDREILFRSNQIDGITNTSGKNYISDKPQIICPCPSEDCRGFIMKASKYSCGICDCKICKDCHVIIEANHECKPENIESVKLIMKECKACPGCGVPSRKTEGCSQVWCISCHKAWNWNTGEIETGRIHATDYLNYLRRTGEEIPRFDRAEGPCHETLDVVFRKIYKNIKKASQVLTKDLEECILKRYQAMAEYEADLGYVMTQQSNMDLRIKYLRKEISHDKWKQMLYKRDKEFTLKSEIHRMRCAYTVSIRDAITHMGRSKDLNELKNNIETIQTIHNFMVTEYKTLMKKFHSKRICHFDKR